jgi:hypothetical protein
MCRKSSGAPFLTWASFGAKNALTYTAGTPAVHRSSQYAQREFCGKCGSQLVFRADRLSSIDVAAGSLDDVNSIAPQANIWTASRVAWLHGFDGTLPDIEGNWPGDET